MKSKLYQDEDIFCQIEGFSTMRLKTKTNEV